MPLPLVEYVYARISQDWIVVPNGEGGARALGDDSPTYRQAVADARQTALSSDDVNDRIKRMLIKVRYLCMRGFTLIELMVVVALVAIMATLAAPSFRDFIVRRNLESVTSAFQSDIMRARSIAINRNICVTMCMSANTSNVNPTCATSGTDWQPGWIVFLNPACNAGTNNIPKDANDPPGSSPRLNLIGARVGIDGGYYLQSQNDIRKMVFYPRGTTNLSGAGEFDSLYGSSNNPLTLKYAKNVCVDALGRARAIPNTSACASY